MIRVEFCTRKQCVPIRVILEWKNQSGDNTEACNITNQEGYSSTAKLVSAVASELPPTKIL